MNIWSYLTTFSLYLLGFNFLIGYLFTHLVLGPWLMNKHNKRKYHESVLWFGNVLKIEYDLKELFSITKDSAVLYTLKLIRFSKYSIVILLVLFIICLL